MVNARSHGQNLPSIDQSATAIPPPRGPAGSGSVYLLGRLDQSRSAHQLDLSPIVRADDACFAQVPANVAAFRRYEIGRENAHCPWVQWDPANDLVSILQMNSADS